MTEEKKEITLGELGKMQRAGNINMSDVKAEGICTIIDKDGNVKSTMRICSVEEAEAEYEERMKQCS